MKSNRKVLVIDDEESIITYLTTILEDEGYEPLSALDGDEGYALARAERPALICLDIMMPRRSGLTMYQEFKLDPLLCEIPIVFISAFNRIRDLRDPVAFRKMISDERVPQPECFLEKPIKVAEFVEMVEELTGTSSKPLAGVSEGSAP